MYQMGRIPGRAMSVQPYLHLLDDVSGNRPFLRRERAEQNRL